jgi:hypothetical protein
MSHTRLVRARQAGPVSRNALVPFPAERSKHHLASCPVTAYLLAAICGVLLTLWMNSIGKGKREQRAYDFIASQQRTLQALDPTSYAAVQLRQQIEAEVLLLNNNLVHPSPRRRAAVLAVIYGAATAAQAVWFHGLTAPSQSDKLVTAFAWGWFGSQALMALRVALHRNRIKPLLAEVSNAEGTPVEEAEPPAAIP